MKAKYISLSILALSVVTFIFSVMNLIRQANIGLTDTTTYIFGVAASVMIMLLCVANFLSIRKKQLSDNESDEDISDEQDTEVSQNIDATPETSDTEPSNDIADDEIIIDLSDIDEAVKLSDDNA